ncbi:hypothetical protein G7070_02715 [Propioniciclava coleopterorum]|uniref:Uncharacterized protein n=1 Tax=Propioniciclava coleopterorum TaxID=2714937 RepID=A0A6G7Y428_9ACTN|nr:hypothetical protein [Propioniciclava coleopterorum]QIK71398.1 hypothetical protein G7070_02715 [Propioniciclava coleopterorum]
MSRPRPSAATLAAGLTGAVACCFILTSALVAILPQFRFESQVPAVLPLFAWAGALGVDGVAAHLGRIKRPWRESYGVFSVLPFLGLHLVALAVPDLPIPAWVAVLVAACVAVPFVLVARRDDAGLVPPAPEASDARSRRGTALVGVALALLAYAASGPLITAATAGVLTAVALGVAALRTGGLARAGRAWDARQWAAAAWGSLVVWVCVILHGTTPWLISLWADLLAMLLAAVPLILASGVRPPAALRARLRRPDRSAS